MLASWSLSRTSPGPTIDRTEAIKRLTHDADYWIFLSDNSACEPIGIPEERDCPSDPEDHGGETRNSKPVLMITVSCLILLDSQNAFLATQRPPHKSLGGLWEFPGGKVEKGESPEEALRRELREELHLSVDSLIPLTPVAHHYDFGSIRLIPFLARCEHRPALELVEHSAACWANSESANSLEWAPADLPILAELLSRLQQRDLKNRVPPYSR